MPRFYKALACTSSSVTGNHRGPKKGAQIILNRRPDCEATSAILDGRKKSHRFSYALIYSKSKGLPRKLDVMGRKNRRAISRRVYFEEGG